MTTDPTDKRSLIVSAASEDELLRCLRNIPGYVQEALGDELRRRMALPADEQRFWLRSDRGERIIVRHRRGEALADTVNVETQDRTDAPIPMHEDEIVRLHHAIADVDGISSMVVASDRDLLPPEA